MWKNISKQLFAWRLMRDMPVYEHQVANIKQRLLSGLSGTVVELGPGAGGNLAYFQKNITWIGIEPNPYLQKTLIEHLKKTGISGKVVTGFGEHIPLADRSADYVVTSLVFCSVADPEVVIKEIRRVLVPGGKWVFVEHVGAKGGSWQRLMQDIIAPIWKILGDGCCPNRDLEAAIGAGGFKNLQLERHMISSVVIWPHIAGIATK